jgi:hypothetical protein
MYRFIGASSSRWGLLIPQLEDVRWVREAPTFLFSGGYVAARRRHTLMMLIPDGKGRERLYEACRIKRWVAPKGKQTTKRIGKTSSVFRTTDTRYYDK